MAQQNYFYEILTYKLAAGGVPNRCRPYILKKELSWLTDTGKQNVLQGAKKNKSKASHSIKLNHPLLHLPEKQFALQFPFFLALLLFNLSLFWTIGIDNSRCGLTSFF